MDRSELHRALRDRYPWLAETEFGPAAVDAGECGRCGAEARLVTRCGPGAAQQLGRRCASELGRQGWCSGHVEQAERALAWLARLPPEADDVARLWWAATGEIRIDPDLLEGVRQRAGALPDTSLGDP